VCYWCTTGPSGGEIILFTLHVRMYENKVTGRKIGPKEKLNKRGNVG